MEHGQLEKIRNRQLARFITHLKKTGQLTPGLESDVKRAYRFIFEDVEALFEGRDKEIENAPTKKEFFAVL